jgi:single-strand DNA-binding protein
MPALNKVMFIGNLTRDPQTKELATTSLVEFGLAMSRRFKTQSGEEKEEVCFVDCTAFGRTGEVIAQYCTKGKPIFIEGRLKYDVWDDKNGGGKRSKLSVVVENLQFLAAAHSVGSNEEAAPKPDPAAAKARSRGKAPVAPAKFKEADIPF